VEDGQGFPIVVLHNGDDEHLMVQGEERFCSPVDVTAVVHDGAPVPVARRVMGQEGVVLFRIDISAAELRQASRYCFRHEETGAELQITVPHSFAAAKDDNYDDEEHYPENMTSNDHMVEEQFSEDDDSEMNEFEEDGFVVGDDEHDDDDVCCLCHDGGELIVCDGGDFLKGCGCYFHIKCVTRKEIPPGDWVCQGCANAIGLEDVGIEGHEFPLSTHDDEQHSDASPVQEERRRKRLKGNDKYSNSSDEEGSDGAAFSSEAEEKGPGAIEDSDEESDHKVAASRKPVKRQRIIDSDDEE